MITDKLSAFWALDESSGNRSAAKGGITLVDNNTVTSAAGVVSNAAQFTAANSEYFTASGATALEGGNIDWTWMVWVFMDSKPANIMRICEKEPGTGNDHDISIYWSNSADRFGFSANNTSDTGITVTDSVLGAPSTSTWYQIFCWFVAATGTGYMQINNGSLSSASKTGDPVATTGTFYVGSNTGTQRYWNGRMDNLARWGRVLSSAERSWLFNSGNSRSYTEMLQEPRVQVVSAAAPW